MHRPGHSPSDTLFWDAERRLLIAGDHLLAHISSNPLVTRPLTRRPDHGDAPARADRPTSIDARAPASYPPSWC